MRTGGVVTLELLLLFGMEQQGLVCQDTVGFYVYLIFAT